MEKKTFADFAKSFFTTKQFMFTYTSLQALVDISQHKALSPHLKKLIFGTNAIPQPNEDLSFRLPNQSDSQRTDQQKQHHWNEYQDQACLAVLGAHATMLASAFVRVTLTFVSIV
jgi:hypothetical protein